MMHSPISRRTVLRGLGAAVALPWLEAMGPMTAWATQSPAQGTRAPNRMAFLYVPNGKHMAEWTPTSEGANYTLPILLVLGALAFSCILIWRFIISGAIACGSVATKRW